MPDDAIVVQGGNNAPTLRGIGVAPKKDNSTTSESKSTSAELTDDDKRTNRSLVQGTNTARATVGLFKAPLGGKDAFVAATRTAEAGNAAIQTAEAGNAALQTAEAGNAALQTGEAVVAGTETAGASTRLGQITTNLGLNGSGKVAQAGKAFIGVAPEAGALGTTGAVVGRAFSVGAAAFAVVDIAQQAKSGDTTGAWVNGTCCVVGGLIGGALGFMALASNPVGWAVAGALIFGACTGIGFGNLTYNVCSGRLFKSIGSLFKAFV